VGPALESGFLQGEIARTAEARAGSIATGHQELTGVSTFPRLADDGVKVAPHPTTEPVVKGGTSVAPLLARRLAEPFERLREASDANLARTGKRPQVFLACLGDPAAYSARATWAKNFLAAGGIEAMASESLHNSADAGKTFAESGASLACICSSDTVYAELAEATAGALRAAGARQVLLAGRPKQQEAALAAAGVDAFISVGGNALTTLARIYDALGISHPLRL
jgi:methylmalonyl-CoA mutase